MKKYTSSGKQILMPFVWAGCPNAYDKGDEVHYPCNLCHWELPAPEVTDNGAKN